MITLTDNAIEHLKEKLASSSSEEGGTGDRGLRLLVERGGCAGMQYAMKVDTRAEGDSVFGREGVHVLVDAESLVYLSGVELDYHDDLTDSGFKINNPNAARSCGCGTSFEPTVAGQAPTYDESMDGAVCGGSDDDSEGDR
ncbi:MAG: iron-sulfur cluster assembly accessory protein [Verrucomicrobiae bacterium]|nr:iron-sulfur cluster assembly accessory protein [Verrucomicrobiae bacterium]